MRKQHIEKILIIGVFAEACVSKTAEAALRLGFTPVVLSDAVAGASHEKRETALQRLQGKGITVTTSADFLAEQEKILSADCHTDLSPKSSDYLRLVRNNVPPRASTKAFSVARS